MAKASQSAAKGQQPAPAGIFGPSWHNWRGAVLHISLDDEPYFLARLNEVRDGRADLTELDAEFRPVKQRELPWPPEGTVRVLRTP